MCAWRHLAARHLTFCSYKHENKLTVSRNIKQRNGAQRQQMKTKKMKSGVNLDIEIRGDVSYMLYRQLSARGSGKMVAWHQTSYRNRGISVIRRNISVKSA